MEGVSVTPVKPSVWVLSHASFRLVLEFRFGMPIVHWLKCRRRDLESAGSAVGDFLINGPVTPLIKGPVQQPRSIAVGAMILGGHRVDHWASTETVSQFIRSIISELPAVGVPLKYTVIAHPDVRVSFVHGETPSTPGVRAGSPEVEALKDMYRLLERYPAYCLCEINYFRTIDV